LEQFAVIPAVDVLGEEAVRLRRGRYDEVVNRSGNPVTAAARLARAGASYIHLVDLDGARSGCVRPELVARVVEAAEPARVQASGGIRSVADAEALLAAGATRVVVGTAAFAALDAAVTLARALGDRLVVAVDVRDGRVKVAGWTEDGGLPVEEAVARCAAAGVSRLLCTAVERDGTLAGPDLELLRLVCTAGIPVLAAGGIRSEDDLRAVEAAGCEGAVVGRALLEGGVPLTALGQSRAD
jgi:phosphoribosylformimino-5-aminoimidazole carboxamide ribotide isomerase